MVSLEITYPINNPIFNVDRIFVTEGAFSSSATGYSSVAQLAAAGYSSHDYASETNVGGDPAADVLSWFDPTSHQVVSITITGATGLIGLGGGEFIPVF